MEVNRRQFIAVGGVFLTLAGCTGGGPGISVWAHNKDDANHSVTAWAVQGGSLEVANTVTLAPETSEPLGEMPSDHGTDVHRYRVTVKVDDEVVLAREFQPEDWFNNVDITVELGGSVKLDWYRYE